MLKTVFFIIFQIFMICSSQEITRKLDAQLNPGCPPDMCDNGNEDDVVTLIHILAEGKNDCLHYLWDFTGKPTVLIALTSLNTSVTINWNRFMNDEGNSIQFSKTPLHTATLVINKLWEFNDAEDTGTLPVTNPSEINSYDTQNFTWVRTDFHKSVHEVEVAVAGDNTYFFGDGKIKLKLKCFAVRDHDIDLPHLLHSENSTQVDVVLDNIKVDSRFKFARFAAEVILITDEQNTDDQSFSVYNRKSLDDEHTPGIFEVMEIASPESLKAARGTYIQYRPVSYTHPERDVSTSTELHITIPTNLDNPVKQLNASLAWAYYGYLLDEVLVQGFNVTFGLSGDGFYTRTNYNTWTFVMGYGAPPNEQISMFIVIVASIGLGLPLLLLVGGGCYICIRRVRNH